MSAAAPTVVVVARSARMLAEAAAREGLRVIALDVFGDVDTRRAAAQWHPIGTQLAGTSPRIDGPRLLAALAAIAHASPSGPNTPLGWIAGSDLETDPDLLDAAAQKLPLIGTPPAAVRRVRDPACFFAALDELGLAHPVTSLTPPAEGVPGPSIDRDALQALQSPHVWLRKHARGCGGWHIRAWRPDSDRDGRDHRVGTGETGRRARGAPADPDIYFQREAPGLPMSLLFVAGLADPESGAARHRAIGLNELIVRPLGARPHVYRGALGPVSLPTAATARLRAAVDALVEHFGLLGLCSLDFLWHEGTCSLLEINPRPSASMALYATHPVIAWHLQACGVGWGHDAPSRTPPSEAPGPALSGVETVFARRAFTLGPTQAQALCARGDCHDLPEAGTHFALGDPVCSVSALGNNPPDLRLALAALRQQLRRELASAPSDRP